MEKSGVFNIAHSLRASITVFTCCAWALETRRSSKMSRRHATPLTSCQNVEYHILHLLKISDSMMGLQIFLARSPATYCPCACTYRPLSKSDKSILVCIHSASPHHLGCKQSFALPSLLKDRPCETDIGGLPRRDWPIAGLRSRS